MSELDYSDDEVDLNFNGGDDEFDDVAEEADEIDETDETDEICLFVRSPGFTHARPAAGFRPGWPGSDPAEPDAAPVPASFYSVRRPRRYVRAVPA